MSKTAPSTHERLSVHEDVAGSSDRSFGIVMAVFFGLVGVWPAFFGGSVRWWAIGIAAAFAVLAVLLPRTLAPLNWLWFRFGLLLNGIISPVVMGVLFYGLFTPYGALARWRGRDPLNLRFEPDAESYWVDRDPPGPAPESIKDQF